MRPYRASMQGRLPSNGKVVAARLVTSPGSPPVQVRPRAESAHASTSHLGRVGSAEAYLPGARGHNGSRARWQGGAGRGIALSVTACPASEGFLFCDFLTLTTRRARLTSFCPPPPTCRCCSYQRIEQLRRRGASSLPARGVPAPGALVQHGVSIGAALTALIAVRSLALA